MGPGLPPRRSLFDVALGDPNGSNWQTDPSFHRSAVEAHRDAQLRTLAYQQARFTRHEALAHALLTGHAFISEPEPEPEPVENTGVEVGEVIAYRCWKVRGGFLQSAYRDDVWAPGEVMEGEIGGDRAITGINAYKKMGKALEEYGVQGTTGIPMVAGKVAMWGEMIEHENGYRSQYAVPVSLDYIIPDTWMLLRRLRKLRKRYEIQGD